MKKVFAFGISALLIAGFAIVGCGATSSNASGPGPSYGPGTPLTPPTATSTSAATAGGGGGSSAETKIGMDATNFTQHSITVKANTPITLDNTVNGGGFHIICVGSGQGGQGPSACDKSGDGPSQLYGNGLTVTNGSTPTITFPTTGKYHVICTVHPGMYIDVTVI
jgi:plastocyanin